MPAIEKKMNVPHSAIEPRHSYKALLWDNDGVLVDTEQWYFQATREVLAEVGIELTEALYFEHFLASSNGISLLAAAQGFSESEITQLRQKRDRLYEQHLEGQPLAIPGARETLQALRPHFIMGIVTSSRRRHFETIHRHTGFLEYFDYAITADECENCKPAPDPYLQAIARSGFPAANCLAIEDAPRGLVAARAAGLDCWIVPTTLSRYADFSGATRKLGGITEVVSLLLDFPVKSRLVADKV
jgi:HAD superfamily hydrolase (TIGR01509 family)